MTILPPRPAHGPGLLCEESGMGLTWRDVMQLRSTRSAFNGHALGNLIISALGSLDDPVEGLDCGMSALARKVVSWPMATTPHRH